MGFYDYIISIIDNYVVFCLFPCILTLWMLRLAFGNKPLLKKALDVVRWFIIGYTVVTVLHFINGMIFMPEEYAFTKRATGPYWFFYWFMLICAAVLPFTLLVKKLASNYLYVLMIAILMKIGFYFERFVIIATTIHRDYLPPADGSSNGGISIFTLEFGEVFLQGFILALVLLLLIVTYENREMFNTKPKT